MGFLSDIHGNLEALDAVLAEFDRRGVASIYVAGDLFLDGDDPLGVWRRLVERRALCVRGVSDTALIEIDPTTLRGIDEASRARIEGFRKTREALGELVLHEVKKLPERLRIPLIDGREILVVHGSPHDSRVEITHDMDEHEVESLVDDDPADIVVCGASHIPFRIPLAATEVLSVGSVGRSPEGRVAHFAVLTPRMDGAEIVQDFVEY